MTFPKPSKWIKWLFWPLKEKKDVPFFSFENLKELSILFVIVMAIRSSIVAPYHVPTPSMSPTIQEGDRLIAWKLSYGLRLPFTDITLLRWGKIQRGDIVVFRYPKDPSLDYVKRIIGLPGDRIQILDDVLYINGQAQEKTNHDFDRSILDQIGENKEIKQLFVEKLGETSHWTMDHIPSRRYMDMSRYPSMGFYTVPEGHYMAVGDNRYNSSDSRSWGPVPEENIVGKAVFVLWSMYFSEDSYIPIFRWKRFGHFLSQM